VPVLFSSRRLLYLFCTADRSDYGRDLANFLIHYLPEGSRSYSEDIPLRLPRLSDLIVEERIKKGFSDRTLVAMGHSLGGDAVYVTINTMPPLTSYSITPVFRAVCAISYPKLFSSVILTETTLFPPSNNKPNIRLGFVSGSLGRRSSWASRLAVQIRNIHYFDYFLMIDKKHGKHSLIRRSSKPSIHQC
jgi:hypothetical protein